MVVCYCWWERTFQGLEIIGKARALKAIFGPFHIQVVYFQQSRKGRCLGQKNIDIAKSQVSEESCSKYFWVLKILWLQILNWKPKLSFQIQKRFFLRKNLANISYIFQTRASLIDHCFLKRTMKWEILTSNWKKTSAIANCLLKLSKRNPGFHFLALKSRNVYKSQSWKQSNFWHANFLKVNIKKLKLLGFDRKGSFNKADSKIFKRSRKEIKFLLYPAKSMPLRD